MTTKLAWYAEIRRRRGTLTALNLVTSERYRACHGRHLPSGETVIREFPIGQHQLPVCGRCGVPFRVPAGYWGNPLSAERGRQR